MGGVPSIPTDRTRTVQVIGAGYSRTGTVSMALALERLLGEPVMHGGTQLFGREDAYVKLWCDVFANRNNKPVFMKLLREATAGFAAVTDVPTNAFIAELVELYPDAKVVLVTRDPDRWFNSMQTLLRDGYGSMSVLKTILWPCPGWRWAPTWFKYLQVVESTRLGPTMSRESILIHNEWVRNHVPQDRLLTMDLKEGWEPLAKFLNKAVPNEPFPHANDGEAMQKFAKGVFRTAMLIWLGILGGAGLLAWVGMAVWRRSLLSSV
ncbi:P-loop containing nucleoside triphosphate hydrolase protein [Trichoderma sp. SZMC 28013]